MANFNISVSGDAAELLGWLATTQGITPAEALRGAIAAKVFFHKEINQGSKVLVLNSDKEMRQVFFTTTGEQVTVLTTPPPL